MHTQNSEQTIRNLFIEHFHALVFISFGIVKDYSQAEDIVQDVFVKIWQNFSSVEHITNLRPYLTTAVKNSSLNYIRNHKVNEERLKDVHSFFNSNTIHQPDEDAQNNIDNNKIHEAVGRIPEKWREAFILSKYENLKYSEIAIKLAVSEKTVEKYMSKALNFLRIELKDLLMIILLLLFFSKTVG
ncbi:MAG: RNA polymerase sigma-70 factor [Bacteroidetes bacterium]|nr:MAG: RNA polymerase sigma-70 factor [Bacteroidota bacterium]